MVEEGLGVWEGLPGQVSSMCKDREMRNSVAFLGDL